MAIERIGSANTSHHILALRLRQPLAVEGVLTGGRVASERDTGRRVLAKVAEDHCLHIDGSAPLVGQPLDSAVGNGTLAVPRQEHGANRTPELLPRIFRELLAQNLPDFGPVCNYERL